MSYHLDHYQRLLAIAQAGLFYGKDSFDQERYQEIQEIVLKLISDLTNEPFGKISQLLTDEQGYPTPKVDVRAFITKEEQILLVEDLQTHEWSLPGGYAEIGLSPKENIIKEVQEETGLVVTVDNLLAIFDTHLRQDLPQLFQYYKLTFSCSVVSGKFIENNETAGMAYFSLDNLPKLSEKRTTKEQLTELFNRTNCYSD